MDNCCADAHGRERSNHNSAARDDPWCEATVLTQSALVIYGATSVQDAECPDSTARIHDGACHNHRAIADTDIASDTDIGVYRSHELKIRLEITNALYYTSPCPVITDRDYPQRSHPTLYERRDVFLGSNYLVSK